MPEEMRRSQGRRDREVWRGMRLSFSLDQTTIVAAKTLGGAGCLGGIFHWSSLCRNTTRCHQLSEDDDRTAAAMHGTMDNLGGVG